MENKRKIELLELMIVLLKERPSIKGMCDAILHLPIITAEAKVMTNFIFQNYPTPENDYKEFTQNEFWLNNHTTEKYWWLVSESYERGKQIRVEFLTKLIDNTKKLSDEK